MRPIGRRSRLRSGPVSSELLTFTLDQGNVLESPNQIAAAIEKKTGRSVTPEVTILASMIASETGSGPPIAKRAVAWAAKNSARTHGTSVLHLLAPNGILGAQGIAGRSYASTAKPPNALDLDIAQKVLEGTLSDPTKGSEYFDSPAAFRRLAGTEGYDPNQLQIRNERMAARGYKEFFLPNVNPDYLRLWRKPDAEAVA